MPSKSVELALVSMASGAVSILAYSVLSKLFQCKNKEKLQEASKIYEEKTLVDQYMLFNYGEANEFMLFDLAEYANVKNCFVFPKRVALLCRDYCPDIFFSDSPHPRRALDVGCAVGRSCLELSKLFDSVVGIDYSVNFIEHCKKIVNERVVDYECTLEGRLNQRLTARLDPDVNVDRIEFEVGDACYLRDDLGTFDLVLASNLICRLVEPMKFIDRLKKLVKPKRYAILSTPFTWGSQYTPEKNWLGGYVNEKGKEVNGIDGLKAVMSDTFDLCHELNVPMMIRETRRKFQYTVCLVTIWQKR